MEEVAELVDGLLQGPGRADFFLGYALGSGLFELWIPGHLNLGFDDLTVFPEVGGDLAQGPAEILPHGLHSFMQEFLLASDLRFGHVVPVQKSFRMKKVEGSQGYARGNGSTVEVCAGHGFSLQVFPVRRRPRLRPHGHQAPWRKL